MKTTKMGQPFPATTTAGNLTALCLGLVCLGMAGAPGFTRADAPDDPAAAVDSADFDRRSRALFDGEILAGWEGNGSWFHVNDGAIVAGRLDQKIPKNEFLCTTEQFDDFDLRMEIRLVAAGDTSGRNAGVQFRSRRPTAADGTPNKPIPLNEVVGYQADVGYAWQRSVWGALYDESRRRTMLAESPTPIEVPWQPASPSGSEEDFENEVWHTPWTKLRIVCKGPRVQIFVNGLPTVDFTETDDSIPRVGIIGLQIHSGPPTEAWYRNLRILSL